LGSIDCLHRLAIPPTRQPNGKRVSTLVLGIKTKVTADQLYARFHILDILRAMTGRLAQAIAVVVDGQGYKSLDLGQLQTHVLYMGMVDDVLQRLIRYIVEHQFLTRRHAHGELGGLNLDRYSGELGQRIGT